MNVGQTNLEVRRAMDFVRKGAFVNMEYIQKVCGMLGAR